MDFLFGRYCSSTLTILKLRPHNTTADKLEEHLKEL